MDWPRLFAFFVLGRICIYFLQIFPPVFGAADWLDWKFDKRFFGKLVRCKICLGVWVYAFWAFVLKMYYPDWYIPVVAEFVIGATASAAAYFCELGWQSHFGVIAVGDSDAI